MIYIGILLIAGAVLFGMAANKAYRECGINSLTFEYVDAPKALAAATALATVCGFGGLLLLVKGVL